MAKWHHECSLEWLRARQSHLTATDIKELLPVTRTGRKRTVGDENYIKVLAGKTVYLMVDDCVSVGAAARGHILEPYAIEKFNNDYWAKLYHWDDSVIVKDLGVTWGLSFSPDALDIEQPDSTVIEASSVTSATRMGEVKCYSPERHLVCGFTDKKDLEERWQIATAMAVCENIESAYLIFYNPSMRNQSFIAEYDRQILSNEIDTVLEIEGNWLKWISGLGKLQKNTLCPGDPEEEERIIEEIAAREALDPVKAVER